MPLLRKMRVHDVLTIEVPGQAPVVVQVRRATDAGLRLCIIAPDEVSVTQARRGELVADQDHG